MGRRLAFTIRKITFLNFHFLNCSIVRNYSRFSSFDSHFFDSRWKMTGLPIDQATESPLHLLSNVFNPPCVEKLSEIQNVLSSLKNIQSLMCLVSWKKIWRNSRWKESLPHFFENILRKIRVLRIEAFWDFSNIFFCLTSGLSFTGHKSWA